VQALKAECGTDFREEHPATLLVSFERKLKYYRVACGDEYIDYDAVTGKIASRIPAATEDWLQFGPGAPMRGVQDGTRLPAKRAWMSTVAVGSDPTEIYSPIRVDRWEPTTPPAGSGSPLHRGATGTSPSFRFPQLC
jgi:hypothetical protein